MNKLAEKKLGDIITLHRGYDLPSSLRLAGDIPVISSSGISGFHNTAKLSGSNVITGRYGTIGEVFYYEGPCWPLNTTLFVEDFKGNNPRYIKYLLELMFSGMFSRGGDKSTVPGVDRNALHDIKLPYISGEGSQARAVEVLVQLDEAIKNNRLISLELENLANAIFDYWFIQFDFPDEAGQPYKSSGGEMVWNDELKREIPVGWTARPIGDVIRVIRGVSYKPTDELEQPSEESISLLKTNNIQDGRITLDEPVYLPATLATDEQWLTKGSVFITMSSGSKAHMGKTAIVYETLPYVFGAFCGKIEIDEKYRCFLSTYFRSRWFRAYIENVTAGTSINNIGNEHLATITLPFPNSLTLKKYEETISCFFDLQGHLMKETHRLLSLREYLLPVLLNGQALVGD